MEQPAFNRETMMAPLLDACPSFWPAWQSFLDDWGAERDMPMYIALGDLAVHLLGLLAFGKTSEFDTVFEVVERWHVDGDAYVREAATIGLLEGIQNVTLNRDPDRLPEFVQWLRPVTRKWWFKLIAYWDGRGTLSED
ncbi:MAG TPA: hypothetical protein VGO52_03625 [Hyphomonadaceae bacterium]|nr:hypothetical protein [Hyphomonadaceae bacterium]